MPTYVVLTRLTPEAAKTPGELKRLGNPIHALTSLPAAIRPAVR